ncbi:hypothetical protein RIF29_29999 [Crotalaria pallida]|uniref:Uncharacterized protein n=1 Tax=Crotalaria pallida TaxID=3830 RepID=A0AAN9EHV9_CROPI
MEEGTEFAEMIVEKEESPRIMDKDLTEAGKESVDTKGKSNPFGPWMLVKSSLRKRKRFVNKQNGFTVAGVMKGGSQRVISNGRFDALNQEEEEVTEVTRNLNSGLNVHGHTDVVLEENNEKTSQLVSLNQQAQKEVRVRNAKGGKNPQVSRGRQEWAQPNEKNNKHATKQKLESSHHLHQNVLSTKKEWSELTNKLQGI